MTRVVVTEAHLRSAFEAMRWVDITFELALEHPVRGRVVRARAARLARQELDATYSRDRVLQRRQRPDGSWVTWVRDGDHNSQRTLLTASAETAPGPHTAPATDSATDTATETAPTTTAAPAAAAGASPPTDSPPEAAAPGETA